MREGEACKGNEENYAKSPQKRFLAPPVQPREKTSAPLASKGRGSFSKKAAQPSSDKPRQSLTNELI
jgi:hypothetical protein